MKSWNSTLVNVSPDSHVTRFVYIGKKLESYFSIRDEATSIRPYLLY